MKTKFRAVDFFILFSFVILLSGILSSCRMSASTPDPITQRWKENLVIILSPTPQLHTTPSRDINDIPQATITPNSIPDLDAKDTWFSNLPISTDDVMSPIQDVTIPDGTAIQPGKIFVKSWRIQNSGIHTWNMGYRIGLVQGDPLGAAQITFPHFLSISDNITLNSNLWNSTISQVSPMDIVDLVMVFSAPESPGSYSGTWQLINPLDERLESIIWVSISVIDEPKQIEYKWAGEWLITDPYDPNLGTVHAYLDEDGSVISGIFYSIAGDVVVLEGWRTDEGMIQGTFGPPGKRIVNTFMWKLTQDLRQFQTLNQAGETNNKIICGARLNATIPDPCTTNN